MAMSKAGYLVLFLLTTSAALGGAILSVDSVLWRYAPSHAYGLAGFTVLNVTLIVLLLLRPKKGLLLAGLWGFFELAILIGNIFLGAQFGVTGFTQEELRDYFLGVSISHKGSQIPPTFGFYKISRYAYDILITIQALIAAVGLLAYRRLAARHPVVA